jgi:hypothetical protein
MKESSTPAHSPLLGTVSLAGNLAPPSGTVPGLLSLHSSASDSLPAIRLSHPGYGYGLNRPSLVVSGVAVHSCLSLLSVSVSSVLPLVGGQ